MSEDELNALMDRLQAATWSAAHIPVYDSDGHRAASVKTCAIRQQIRDYVDYVSARLCLFQDVANASERLHATINMAERNHDAWNGKGGTPPSHEVQQALSAECVAADEAMTAALSGLSATSRSSDRNVTTTLHELVSIGENMSEAIPLHELKRMMEAGTPGPWMVYRDTAEAGTRTYVQSNGGDEHAEMDVCRITGVIEHSAKPWIDEAFSDETRQRNEADAALIVAMRNALPSLIAVVDAAMGLCDHANGTFPREGSLEYKGKFSLLREALAPFQGKETL